MSDQFLYIGGALAILVSLAQGFLETTKVVTPAVTPAPSAKRILYAIMVISAVYWFAAGALLMATPKLFGPEARQLAAYGCAFMFACGGIGNIRGMRGRHFGGYALLAIGALAVLGAN